MEELLILNFQYHTNALLSTTKNSQSSSINKHILVQQKQKQLYKVITTNSGHIQGSIWYIHVEHKSR